MNFFTDCIHSLFCMPGQNYMNIFLRLLFAVIVGGAIGLERTGRNQDAGLKTHILVCLGAAGIMVLSETVHHQYGGDIARFGAQVISGIGFLGAGCIMIKGEHVSGLTTAAGLWTTACIGLTIGMGYFFISSMLALLLLFSMLLLRPLSNRIRSKKSLCHYTFLIRLGDRTHFSIISDYIITNGVHVDSIESTSDNTFLLSVNDDSAYFAEQFLCRMMEKKEILDIRQVLP